MLQSSEVADKPAPPEALLRLAGLVGAPCPAQDGASSGASSAQVRDFSNAGCHRISAGRHVLGTRESCVAMRFCTYPAEDYVQAYVRGYAQRLAGTIYVQGRNVCAASSARV